MKELYGVAGISKQAVQQHMNRRIRQDSRTEKFFEQADKIRKDHPRVGCRKMARELCGPGWGRDKTEQWLLRNGYRVQYRPNYTRTTYAQQEIYYPNLIEGLELTDINQVVQTDITYYRVGHKFYYLVFLIDVYSRQIVGYSVNTTMHATGNIKALNQLLKTRSGQCLQQLIHHSDRGSQYVDKQYGQLLRDKGIRPSMCKAGWENAYSERINRTIKDEYLDGWKITDYKELKASVKRAVTHYNTARTHSSLNATTPIQYEKHLKTIPMKDRIPMKLYQQK